MDGNRSALDSTYIIDGITRELTPAQILDACLAEPGSIVHDCAKTEPIIDEELDTSIKACDTSSSRIGEYLDKVMRLRYSRKNFLNPFPESYAKGRVAAALIDAIWRRGHFRLGNLTLDAFWKWDSAPLGNMSAFYSTVEAACDYIDALGLRIHEYSFEEVPGASSVLFRPHILATEGVDEENDAEAYSEQVGVDNPSLGARRKHPASLRPDPKSWIIYVPFEVCNHRLGGSLLSRVQGATGELPPAILDADYFMDCYEVVRELVEDNIILSGVTVSGGGLLTALKSMAAEGTGAEIDLSGLIAATGESNLVRLLFSEVPGVIIQIADIDYDYIDAELLLQDVAFYPLGHPVAGTTEVTISMSEKSGIQNILESIIRSQSSEGED